MKSSAREQHIVQRPAQAATQPARHPYQAMAGANARAAQLKALADGVRDSPRMAAQRQALPNRTGLPDGLKAGVESLSGMSLNHVKVHYNSSKPAQMNAAAYAQGSDIHMAPGQEKHLPHEAWHVVQQAQSRVRPTTSVGGVAVNGDAGLEREADVMGAKAGAAGATAQLTAAASPAPLAAGQVAQRYSLIPNPKGQLAEDKSAIVTADRALLATSGAIETSNGLLAQTGRYGSMIKLNAGKSEAHDNVTYHAVQPAINRQAYWARMNNNQRSFHGALEGGKKEQEKMTLWADCRRASEAVTGASSAMGAPDRRVKLRGEKHAAYAGRIERPSGTANDNTTARMAFQVYALNIEAFIKKFGFKAALKPAELKKHFPEAKFKGWEDVEKWFAENGPKAVSNISIAERLYASMTPAHQQEFHKELGTNEFANPEVGDAYSTVTEFGMPDFESSGNDWLFHWGGVVMKAGSDNITLENLSVGDESVQNASWFFAMYGTAKPEQTFHHRQKNTGHHGNVATTIVVETEGRAKNQAEHKLRELRDRIELLGRQETGMGFDLRVELLEAALDYNAHANTMGAAPITVREVLGPDRKFIPQDWSDISPVRRRFMPK
jgi:hypothetical protein